MKSYTQPTLGMVVLAAGFSSRLGHPKALATVRGRNLLTRTIQVLAAAARYRIGISAGTVTFAANRCRASGLSSSIRLGIHLSRYNSAVLLLPVDLVHLSMPDIGRLIARWQGSRRRVAARRIGSGAGTPLILPRCLYASAAQLTGDEGLRDVIRRLPSSALSRIDMPSAITDVDTAKDLERARRHLHRS